MKWPHAELRETAQALVRRGKGILAADESLGTIEKRFSAVGITNSLEARRRYRELLFAPGMSDFIRGVILFEETIRQHDSSGVPLAEVLQRHDVIPGIKVDRGAKPLPGFPADKITFGLDGLAERLAEYRELGAKFAKWRAVLPIGDGSPSEYAIEANAQQLALYAGFSQEARLVPIVEPEVLMDGAHSLERCYAATEATLKAVFRTLRAADIFLGGILLKPNMVTPGKDNPPSIPPRGGRRADRTMPACGRA